MRAIFSLALLVAPLLLAPKAFAASAEEEAGDVSEVDKDALGPLRERVPPVSGFLFLKKHRFEFSPGLGISAKDAFYTKYWPGAAATYWATEHVGVAIRGGFGIDVVSGAAQICSLGPTGKCTLPTQDQLNQRAPGQIGLIAGLDLEWAPLYGKLSLIAEKFVHFDMYGIAGPSLVQYVGGAGSTMTFGGNIGLGVHFYINKWLGLRTELRDLIYDESFGNQSFLRNQLLVDFGLSMFFPTAFQEG